MEGLIIFLLGFLICVGGTVLCSFITNERIAAIGATIFFISGVYIIYYALSAHTNLFHSNNCTCKECTPIAVKEYCPCGCGQYEIVYR